MSSTVAREAEAGNVLKNASACSFLACGSRSPTKACSACLSRGSWISPKTVCCDAWPRYRTVSTSCGRAFPHSRAISAAKARIDLSCLMGQRVLGLKDAQDLFMPRWRCRRTPECFPLAYLPMGHVRHRSLAIEVALGPGAASPSARLGQIPHTSTLDWPTLTRLRNILAFHTSSVGSRITRCPASAALRFM